MSSFTASASAIVSILVIPTLVYAQAMPPRSTGTLPERVVVAQADASMTEGEVRKIDKEARKITLKHGEIKNLQMPRMTMVFEVKDPSILDSVKTGDKVRFMAEDMNGSLVVTRLELAK